ncbi:MAG TPA: undecaprenyl-phosphate glucose phosphotransferase [Ignavibacteriales bacterium]|nr:undecaprenyl-phosphate glucose phosphotransferase [Ignavibacteriales bacterium]HOL81530.1 undecaprenyl-phosphate glucose phosphotransferase [Ignavibacteriales bacterium]HOM65640.1 undecaprenyl-phosphate glucose phosphotransferase [Ignavibacteriales bacterium]HPP33644.1 undecaprenyl-phosphate glucose phosphotransferase [Ignavibacteriales bacterium]
MLNIKNLLLFTGRLLFDLFIINAVFIFIFIKDIPNWYYKAIPISILFTLSLSWYLISFYTLIYDEYRSRNFFYEILGTVKTFLGMVVILILYSFFTHINLLDPKGIIVFTVTCLLVIIVEKFLIRKVLDFLHIKGKHLKNILIIGAGDVGKGFYDAIVTNPQFGYNLVGFLDDKPKEFLNGDYLGTISELPEVLQKHRVDDVVIALPNYAYDRIEDVIEICKKFAVRVKIIPDYFKWTSQRFEITMFGKYAVVSLRKNRLSYPHRQAVKRSFDIVFSLLVIILLFSWLFPIMFVLQKIFNPGPIFYKATRWGLGGVPFKCYKFRSMVPQSKNITQDGKHNFTKQDDPRITPFGKFLRKTNLDELPQFFNILKGDMSVVGPRPHDEQENKQLREKLDEYMVRHTVKPGITGWAQINGYRGGTSNIELMEKRTQYDIWYIENWSLWLDIQIILITVLKTITGDKHAY